MHMSGKAKQRGFHIIGCLEALSLHVYRYTRDARALLWVLVPCKKGTATMQKIPESRSAGLGNKLIV
jgi:hypothetical protein